MTNDERTRRIAEFLEPEPPWWPQAWPYSPMKAWEMKRQPMQAVGTIGEHRWYARDFFTDESANALLLEKMPRPELLVEREYVSGARLWYCSAYDRHDPREATGRNKYRKTAVVLAFEAWMQSRRSE